ncbi:MAG: undecaprenyl-diphosphate phosphatase, partial [Clostridioides sp.]|nr:undecaprenyl-diphosphate phosphatase [Clostridioides sp.]
MNSFIEILKAVVLGVVQGITEWLPVSSTGHMILVNEFIKMNFSEKFINTFLVVIQFGSILAVLMIFFRKLNPFDSSKNKVQRRETIDLWIKVLIAVVPSGVIGVLFEDKIDEMFFNSTVVALALIIYGVIMIMLESRNKKPKYKSFGDVTY